MENYTYLFGFIPKGFFLVMMLFAAIGVLIALLIDSTKRDQTSKNTPEKFSWWFLIKDNWKPILISFLAIMMTLRFAGSFFPEQFSGNEVGTPIGKEKWLFGSLLIGLLYDTLLQFLKDKAAILAGLLKSKRE